MYEAVIFDLDGTLVQTEKLKADSYARAAIEMCPRSITEEEVIEAFKEVVGRSRQEVATFLMNRFDLEAPATARRKELGVGTAWQAFSQIRLRIYDKMLADPEVLTSHRWPHRVSTWAVAHPLQRLGALPAMPSGRLAVRSPPWRHRSRSRWKFP